MKRQRNTRQRRLVLEAARSHRDHPTADQIFLDVRKIDNKVSRATVYRNLNLLVKNGELLHVKIFDADRFDYRLDFHHHLQCMCCGAVCDAPLPYDAEHDRDTAVKTGYLIKRHCAVFEGICPECQRKSGDSALAD